MTGFTRQLPIGNLVYWTNFSKSLVWRRHSAQWMFRLGSSLGWIDNNSDFDVSICNHNTLLYIMIHACCHKMNCVIIILYLDLLSGWFVLWTKKEIYMHVVQVGITSNSLFSTCIHVPLTHQRINQWIVFFAVLDGICVWNVMECFNYSFFTCKMSSFIISITDSAFVTSTTLQIICQYLRRGELPDLPFWFHFLKNY